MLSLEPKKQVQRRFNIGNTQYHSWTNKGLLPPLLKMGRRSYLPSHEVDAVIRARIAGKSDDEIKALVTNLVAARVEAVPQTQAA